MNVNCHISKITDQRISSLFLHDKKLESSDVIKDLTETENFETRKEDINNNVERQNQRIDFSRKNRSKEIKRLARAMDLSKSDLNDLLRKQLDKILNNVDTRDEMSAKVQYINWILDGNCVAVSGDVDKTTYDDGNDRRNKVYSDRSNLQNTMPALKASSSKSPKERSSNDNKDKEAGHKLEIQPNPRKKQKKLRVIKPVSRNASSQVDVTNEINPKKEMKTQDHKLLSNMKFDEVNLHPLSKRALKETLKITHMTEIQAKTFEPACVGHDILGRARTGTGKTLAFLVPAVERYLHSQREQKDQVTDDGIGILVISPTRELATQIGDQADKLLSFHSKQLTAQVMYGGVKMSRDTNLLNKRLPTILIATPGRLLDHMENTVLNRNRKFGYDIMRQTGIVVFDETDRLLDMGFRRAINKILAFLPKKEKRQTFLFSATLPKELRQVMSENMRHDFIEIDCIGGCDDPSNQDVESGAHTNAQVQQSYAILPSLDRYVVAVVEVVRKTMEKQDSTENKKIVVFFSTANTVAFFANFFNKGLGIQVIELHSRKSQASRNSASDGFRKAKNAILFTSDVSARGVDYPDVTDVIQFGLPESREQYIHRLGRTGRAGKGGKGLLVLAPFESKFLHSLNDLDITKDPITKELLSQPVDPVLMKSIEKVLSRIKSGDSVLTQAASRAYQAFLGFYVSNLKKTSHKCKEDVVSTANAYASLMGLSEPPALEPRTVGKMGLKGVKGIVIGERQPHQGQHRGNNQNRKL